MNVNVALVSVVEADGADAIVTVGGVVSGGVQVQATPAGPTLPALSAARTQKTCSPAPSPASVFGVAHAAYAAPSSLHENDAPASLALKAICTPAVDTTPDGARVIVTSAPACRARAR